MNCLHIGLLFIRLISLCNGILNDLASVPVLGLKSIRKKDGTTFKIYKSREHLQFPGNDREKLGKINKMWTDYYACLNNLIQQQTVRKPIIIQIMEGQYTVMKCPYCQKPFQSNNDLNWRYKPLTSDLNDPEEPEILDLTKEMVLTQKKTLKIYNALAEYSGLYVCYNGNNSLHAYILEVVKDQRIELLDTFPTANDTIRFPDGSNVVVYYKWSKWTECSAYDIVGKKYKYGACMAKVENYQMESNTDAASGHTIIKKQTSDLNKTLHKRKTDDMGETNSSDKEEAKNLLNKFETGIPCTSRLFPDVLKQFTDALNKTPTVAIAEFCRVPRPEGVIYEVIDQDGNVLETANNSAGIYSAEQALPLLPPEVERKTMDVQFGSDIVLQCPGNIHADIPVTWMIDKLILIPELIANESHGRITVDVLSKLHINHLRLKDSNIYSCWQRQSLAGTIRLNVEKPLKLSVDHHMILLTMLCIIIMILYVGIKILRREVRLKKYSKLTT